MWTFSEAPQQSDDLPMDEAVRLMNTLVTRMQDQRPANELEWAMQQPQFQRIKAASTFVPQRLSVSPAANHCAIYPPLLFTTTQSIVQKNSEMLFPLLEQLGRISPDLMQLIGDNQGDFMEWVNDEAPQVSFGAPLHNAAAQG